MADPILALDPDKVTLLERMNENAGPRARSTHDAAQARRACYQAAERATAFLASRAAFAALADAAARAQNHPQNEQETAHRALQKSADTYYAAFRLHYLAHLEAAGLPPDAPKTPESDSPTVAG